MEYNWMTELYHYGVKGQKWGVRRYQNPDGSLKKGHKNRYGEWPPNKSDTARVKTLTDKVSKAHKMADTTERYIGQANAALQASKGHRVLSVKSKQAGDRVGERIHDRKSKQFLSEYERYDRLSQKSMTGFLKTKLSALVYSENVKDGKKYIDSLAGLTINLNNVDEYENQYKLNKRYAEGYEAERRHIKDIVRKNSYK